MVQVDKDFFIEIDESNFIAKRDKHRKDKHGREETEIIGYYASLKGALQGVYRYKARKCLSEGQKSLYEAIQVHIDLNNQFLDMITKQIGESID